MSAKGKKEKKEAVEVREDDRAPDDHPEETSKKNKKKKNKKKQKKEKKGEVQPIPYQRLCTRPTTLPLLHPFPWSFSRPLSFDRLYV